MLFLILIMVVIVALAALVVTFVAVPHRGEQVPNAPWLGDAMARAAEAAPTLPTEGDEAWDERHSIAHRSGPSTPASRSAS